MQLGRTATHVSPEGSWDESLNIHPLLLPPYTPLLFLKSPFTSSPYSSSHCRTRCTEQPLSLCLCPSSITFTSPALAQSPRSDADRKYPSRPLPFDCSLARPARFAEQVCCSFSSLQDLTLLRSPGGDPVCRVLLPPTALCVSAAQVFDDTIISTPSLQSVVSLKLQKLLCCFDAALSV
jgi:hypothetical protein